MYKRSLIVFYDGICIFCEGWVKFIIKYKASFLDIKFIPLQNIKINESFRIKYNINTDNYSSIIVLKNKKYYFKSDASIIVMKHLKFPFNLIAKILQFIPLRIRNFFYDFIGKRRYKIFGKKNSCSLPINFDKEFFASKFDDIPDEHKNPFQENFTFY